MEDQKEMLTLKDLEEKYGFNPNTIMRERWEMKKVKQQKPKCENGKYYLKIKAKDGSEYTQEVKKMDSDSKKLVLKFLWKIILSDDKSDIYENTLMRRICGLLYLPDKLSGEIKLDIIKEKNK